jgi:acetate kinase
VVNAGSSSLKLSVLDGPETESEQDVPASGGEIDMGVLRGFVDSVGEVRAVGHRIVHGGTEFRGPVEIDPSVRARLAELTDLAPLHQPKSLAAYDAVTSILPDAVAVACFDTAFHSTIPAEAATYALPAEWRHRWPLRRFGFHGLSHAYASRRAAEMIGARAPAPRVVTCHLGAGASVAAVDGGRSVDTTMGFTPLDGLVMATRSGSVDPGLILWLMSRTDMSASDLAESGTHKDAHNLFQRREAEEHVEEPV